MKSINDFPFAFLSIHQTYNRTNINVSLKGQSQFIITYNYMTEQQDEFFVQPEVQEVRDLEPINQIMEYPMHQTKPSREEAEHVHLKMVQIPKEDEHKQYRPFRFEHASESQQSEEQEMTTANHSVVQEYYNSNACVYQRFNNKEINEVCNYRYFAGAFIHRRIVAEVNCKETHQIADIWRQNSGKIDEVILNPKKEDLIFDSHFQSGNLFAAYKVSQFQYDLMMSNDTNSMGGSNQWFYFSVANLLPGRNYTFNIANFTKSDSLFNYGMAPVVYSICENGQVQNLEHGWRRFGKDITYRKGKIQRQKTNKFYYCLSFTLFTPHEKDKLYIAHSYPYTLEKLSLFFRDKINRHGDLVTRFTIGKTASRRSIEALMICHSINKKRDNRKAVIIMARQHPGETQGSYVCEGVMDKLLMKCKQTDILLKNYVFYVIPMVNPDGVVYGHYRCNLLGKDLNRKWNSTQRDQNCPQVTSIKSFIQELSREREIRFIIDLHGHSKKLNSFFYGNPYPEHPEVVRIFPYVCSRLHQGIQYFDCTFATEECKKKAARVYLSFFYHLIHVYTFESSFYAYFQDGKKIQFTPKEYRKLGATLINGLAMQLEHEMKYQQSFEFNVKNYGKDHPNSPFVKFLLELKNSKQLINIGGAYESGSQSKPEEGQLNQQQMQSLQAARKPESISDKQSHSKTVKITRRGIRDVRDYNYNSRPIRNVRFLEISKINSVLPDRFQLALQPIRKKQSLPEPLNQPLSFNEFQAQGKYQVKMFDLKTPQGQSCNIQKRSTVTERRLSSLIQSMNNNRNNIIIKVEDHIQSLPRPPRVIQIHNRAIKNAFSQTMIIFNKDQGKIRSSQKLPAVQGNQRQRYDLIWPKISQMNINSSTRGDIAKETETLLNGMVKKFVSDKEVFKGQQLANKRKNQKALSLKRSQYSKK